MPLRVEDVHAARAEFESKGVTFFGDTLEPASCGGGDGQRDLHGKSQSDVLERRQETPKSSSCSSPRW